MEMRNALFKGIGRRAKRWLWTFVPWVLVELIKDRVFTWANGRLDRGAGPMMEALKHASAWTIGNPGLLFLYFVAFYCLGVVIQSQFAAHARQSRDRGRESPPPASPLLVIHDIKKRRWRRASDGLTGVDCQFEVSNSSVSTALENVRVELLSMKPEVVNFKATLHIKNESYDVTTFSLNPGASREIDLLTGPINDPHSQKCIVVAHTVGPERKQMPSGRYTFNVMASARNSSPATAKFEVWVDDDGETQCATV